MLGARQKKAAPTPLPLHSDSLQLRSSSGLGEKKVAPTPLQLHCSDESLSSAPLHGAELPISDRDGCFF